MKRLKQCLWLVTAATVGGAFWAFGLAQPAVAEKSAPAILADVQKGAVELKSIGSLSFAPEGVLLIADPAGAAVVGLETGDIGPVVKLKARIDDVLPKVAAALGAPVEDVQIIDMTVNPISGKIYLSAVRSADKQPAIVTFDAEGKTGLIDLKDAKYVRVQLPAGVKNITDLKVAGDRLILAAQSNEEFASKLYSVALPLKHNASGDMISTETYHVAHGKWETKAPIQSFIPHEEGGKQYVVGAFTCTPIAKFGLDDVASGGQVKGTSVVELGSGNRPLDMLAYERDGKQWLVTNTFRVHWKRNLYGPSKWWGVRVNMDYLNADKINEQAALRDLKAKSGPDGIEIVDALAGAVQVAQLQNDEIIVLRADPETDSEAKLSLELDRLP